MHDLLTLVSSCCWGQKVFCPQLMPANCSAAKQLPQFCKHSKSADLLRKSLLSHVWRVPSSKALSCKHERLFDLLTLASSSYDITYANRISNSAFFRSSSITIAAISPATSVTSSVRLIRSFKVIFRSISISARFRRSKILPFTSFDAS